jgi:hypothetical protein
LNQRTPARRSSLSEAAGGGAIVDIHHDKTILEKELVVEAHLGAPLVHDIGSRRTAVNIQDHGVFAGGVKIPWLPDFRGHGKTVGGGNGEKFGVLDSFGKQLRARCRKSLQKLTLGGMKLQGRQGAVVGETVEIEFRVGRHRNGMGAGLGGKTREAGAVAFHAVEVALDGGIFERGKVDPIIFGINAGNRLADPENAARGGHGPVAIGDLVDKGAVHGEAVEMHEAVALGSP